MSGGNSHDAFHMPAACYGWAGTAQRQGGGGKTLVRRICGTFGLAALSLGTSPAAAQSLPQISATSSVGTAEALGNREQQFPAADIARPKAQLTVVRADIPASVSINTGLRTGQVALAGIVDGAQIVASRTSDIVGSPIDIFRPVGVVSKTSMRLPSGMPIGRAHV